MDPSFNLEELLREVKPLVPIVVGAGMLAAGAVAVYLRRRLRESENASTEKYRSDDIDYEGPHFNPEENGEGDEPDGSENTEYPLQTFAEAKESGELCSVQGGVKEFYVTSDGYSGVLNGSGGSILFYIHNEGITTGAEKGLVPILLNHSQKSSGRCELLGQYSANDGIFIVDELQYQMDGKEYIIDTREEESE